MERRNWLIALFSTTLALIAISMILTEDSQSWQIQEISALSQGQKRLARFQILKWKTNLPDPNTFDDFDAGFKQGKFKPVLAEDNVFDDFDKEKERHPWPAQAPEENVLADMPEKYPFNEKVGGHEWKKWEGDTPTDALHEHNVLDNGEERNIYEIGEHTLGKPFREYEPEKNVLEGMDDEPYEWGKTAASVIGVPGTGEKNVLDDLSPDSGY